jgi:hypothetical protein
MLKAIRDKATKEIRSMWEPPADPLLSEPDVTYDPATEEYVELRNMTAESVMKLARAKGPSGRIFLHNDRVEAEPGDPDHERPRTLLSELERIRKAQAKPASAALTWADIEAAAKNV